MGKKKEYFHKKKDIIKLVKNKETHKFIIKDFLGKGGYGEVYKVQNKKDKKFYALKLMFYYDKEQEQSEDYYSVDSNYRKKQIKMSKTF